MRFLTRNGDNEYRKRIENVAEKIHKLADTLREKRKENDRIIDWEDFTVNYMKAGQPSTCSDLERKIWVEKRSNMWKDDVNDKLWELGYQECLFSEHNIGIKLRWGPVAMLKLSLLNIKKICSIANRGSTRLELISENQTGVWIRKGINLAEIMKYSLPKHLYGEIGMNKTLTRKEKAELLQEIESFIPDIQNNKE